MLETFGVNNLFTYILGAALIILVPGPNSIFVLTTSVRHGVRRGYRAALGVFLGDATLIFLTFLGVASLIRTMPLLFTGVRYAGAAYLLFLGGKLLYTALFTHKTEKEQVMENRDHSFSKALILSITNPKVIIFYISFFVQFIDPTYPHTAVPFFILGSILEVFSLIYLSALIFLGSSILITLKKKKSLAKIGSSLVGAMFLGFGLKLAAG